MYIDKDKSNAAAAAATETLDSRTSRPGPVGLSFEIIDAQIVRDDDDKYVVGDLKFCWKFLIMHMQLASAEML